MPDLSDPIILSEDRGGTTVKSICDSLHRTLITEFDHA